MNDAYLLLFRKPGLIAAAQIGGVRTGLLYGGRHYHYSERSGGEFNHWLKEGDVLVGFHLFQASIVYPELFSNRLITHSENVFVEGEDIHILLGAGNFKDLDNDWAQLVDVSVFIDSRKDHLLAIPLLPRIENDVLWRKIGFPLETEGIPIRFD